MGEELIWHGLDIDDLEMTESVYNSSKCQNYIDEECTLFGTPCPSCGNCNTAECLMNDDYAAE